MTHIWHIKTAAQQKKQWITIKHLIEQICMVVSRSDFHSDITRWVSDTWIGRVIRLQCFRGLLIDYGIDPMDTRPTDTLPAMQCNLVGPMQIYMHVFLFPW